MIIKCLVVNWSDFKQTLFEIICLFEYINYFGHFVLGQKARLSISKMNQLQLLFTTEKIFECECDVDGSTIIQRICAKIS